MRELMLVTAIALVMVRGAKWARLVMNHASVQDPLSLDILDMHLHAKDLPVLVVEGSI